MIKDLKSKTRKCKATLEIGDDYGDNYALMRCQLARGHKGRHQETYEANGGGVTVTWDISTEERGRKIMKEKP